MGPVEHRVVAAPRRRRAGDARRRSADASATREVDDARAEEEEEEEDAKEELDMATRARERSDEASAVTSTVGSDSCSCALQPCA